MQYLKAVAAADLFLTHLVVQPCIDLLRAEHIPTNYNNRTWRKLDSTYLCLHYVF